MRKSVNMTFGVAAVAVLCIVSLSTAARAQGNVENGEDVFKKCRACHLVGEGAKDTVGPNLNGVIGRKAGASETYKLYSGNMTELGSKGLAWDDASLDKYLESPKAVAPQGKMAFAGLKEKSDRDDVIAYLKKFTK
jgi:cytochrome c2